MLSDVWVCPYCNWICQDQETMDYHATGACLAIRRLISVIAARERNGVHEHVGLQVGRYRIAQEIGE